MRHASDPLDSGMGRSSYHRRMAVGKQTVRVLFFSPQLWLSGPARVERGLDRRRDAGEPMA